MVSRQDGVLYSFKMVTRDLLQDIDSEKLDEFTKVKTNREKIQLALELGCLEAFEDVSVPFKEKSATLSTAARLRGNELFKAKQYHEALKSYNSGIILAPITAVGSGPEGASGAEGAEGAEGPQLSQSVELAFGFANRSAALYSLGTYEQSLSDIQHALAFGYPPNLQYKLFERTGKCGLGQEKYAEARVALQKAQERSEQAQLDETARAKWEAGIKILLEKCDASLGETVGSASPDATPPITESRPTLPALSGDKSKILPSATTVFGLQQSETQGRYIVAEHDAKVGDVLAVEKPYGAIMYPERCLDYCQHCFKPASTPYPCLHCSSVVYCGKSCQEEAWGTYHNLECKILGYLTKEWVGRLGHLALRVAILATWPTLEKTFCKNTVADEPTNPTAAVETGFDQDGQYYGDYRSTHQLVTHQNNGEVETCFQLSLMAVFLATILAKTDFLTLDTSRPIAELPENSEGEGSALSVLSTALLHQLQVIQCNAFAVAEMDSNHQDLKLCQPRDLGLALYPTVSLLNHSCDPVVDLNFYGSTCVVRAMRNIRKGEEITDDYGPLFLTQSKAERQDILLSRYFFRCCCVACTQNWPQWQELDTDNVMFLCGKCGKKLEGPTNSKKQSIKCKHCGKPQNVNHCLDLLARSHEKYVHAMGKAFGGDIAASLPAIQGHLTLMQRLLCQPWRDFHSCQATVKQCYRLLANRQPCSETH